jgi:hypothetical protein
VRTAIYCQAVIALARILRQWLSPHGHTLIGQTSTVVNVFVTGCALIISAVVQAHTAGLSLYHALIVLNLCWINNFTACFPLASGFTLLLFSDPTAIMKTHRIALFRQLLACLVHFFLMATFGVWIFWDPYGFDNTSPNCSNSTTYDFFGLDVIATNHPFRLFWLIIYALSLIPPVNVFLFGAIFVLPRVAVAHFVDYCRSSGDYRLHQSPIAILLSGIPVLVFVVVDTEIMISRNTVMPGEGRWTFGQTLALLVLYFPLRDLWDDIEKSRREFSGETELSSVDEDEV